nr:MAG TPA: hypothetical protein [Caudoviricetes sp.]
MSNINIDVLGSLDSKIKEMTTTLTDGKNLIKEDFTKTKTNDYVGNLYAAKVSKRVSTKFDEKKVLKIVKENGLDWLLTEVVDLKKLEDALVANEVETELFADCISESETLAVTFRRNKK